MNLKFFGQMLGSAVMAAFYCMHNITLADMKEEVEYRYYAIYPKTDADIELEMESRTPVSIRGTRFMALTNWKVRWRYETESLPSGCMLRGIDTQVYITFTLPSIPQRHKASDSVYRTFDQYFGKMMLHEKNHAENGYSAARDIDSYLHQVRFSHGCGQVEDELVRQTQSIIRFYESRDIEYDRQTGHGRSEGVHLDHIH